MLPCDNCDQPGQQCNACPICLKAGNAVYFCSPFKDNYNQHKKAHQKPRLPSTSGKLKDLTNSTYDLFLTEGCKVTLTTPRLVLRPVSLTDCSRVYAVKSERMVNITQLYGADPKRWWTDALALGYFLDNFPLAFSPSRLEKVSHFASRARYVFGITIAKDEAGAPRVKARKCKATKAMSTEGYIGNIAIQIMGPEQPPTDPAHVAFVEGPKAGERFRYPSTKQLSAWKMHGAIFYEIHPSFWGQGVMTEAVEAIFRYSFDVLRLPSVVIDPREENAASIRIAKRFGATFKEKKSSWSETNGDVTQEIWAIGREEWYEAEKERERGTKQRLTEKASEGCRWCQRADSTATVPCARCDSARWCSAECRLADESFSGGVPIVADSDFVKQYQGGHALHCVA